MNSTKIKLGLSFLIILTIAVTVEGAIGVSTLGVWVTIPAGKTVTGTLTFINYHEEETRLVIKLCDWKRLENGENVLLEPNSTPNSLTPNIKIEPEEALMGPGESQKFKYEITMPEDAVGARWGAILAVPKRRLTRQTDSSKNGEEELSLNELVPYGFTVKIWALEPTTAAPSAKVNSLKSVKTEGDESAIKLELVFENTGNVPLRPKGSLKLFNSEEKEIADYNIDKFGVLPDSKRTITIPDTGIILPEGEIRAELNLTYSNKKNVKKEILLTGTPVENNK